MSVELPYQLTRRAVITVPALLPLLLCRYAGAADPIPVGRVNQVRGTAIGELDQNKRVLTTSVEIYAGEKISTAERSRVELFLGHDTKVRLGDTAEIKVARFEIERTITHEAGPLLLDSPISPASPVVIRGASVDITAYGKVFAGPSQGVLGILVVTGQAEVQAGARKVRLRSGEGTDIKSPGAGPSEPRRWGAPRVKAALASVD
jgi:ferric-dicitrate binding protein FerR (iron transport regulator)